MKKIYLDNAATAPILLPVIWEMQKVLYGFGNPSSLHKSGRDAKKLVANARRQVAKLIGTQPDEIVFTSGGTESNGSVIFNFRNQKIIISAIEHPSIMEPVRRLDETLIAPVNKSGRVNLSAFKKLLDEKPALVSIMLANNETGAIQDVKKIATLAHAAGALVHTDATQAAGKVPIDARELNVDFLTISAHKIGGPKGVGALYIKKGLALEPMLLGGHQENNRRAGTENVASIVGFGLAADISRKSLRATARKMTTLRDKLKSGIIAAIPDVTVNGDPNNSLPHILNVSFAGAEGESILLRLDRLGIEVSTGSACASRDIMPSHVLMAMGADAELAHGSIRFSLGVDTTAEDINKVLKKLPPIVENLRNLSTIGKKYGRK
ncbi:MAG: cysteine desulfurase [Candidatus Nomurabacteria bacterium]|jgi:cysteine desulfurase|nr:cysteine desulfurase [Candidatus Nomurabacteria bacterium]